MTPLRLLHRRSATTLAMDRSPTAAVSALIATHYQHGGLESEAATYFVQAGDQARALFAHQDALHFYQAAIAALNEAIQLCQRYGDRHYEAALRSNLADMLHQSGDETAAQEQIRQSVTIYADIGQAHDSWQAEIWQLMEW